MDWQSIVVAPLILGAMLYVGRAVRESARPRSGCGDCGKRASRASDYV